MPRLVILQSRAAPVFDREAENVPVPFRQSLGVATLEEHPADAGHPAATRRRTMLRRRWRRRRGGRRKERGGKRETDAHETRPAKRGWRLKLMHRFRGPPPLAPDHKRA